MKQSSISSIITVAVSSLVGLSIAQEQPEAQFFRGRQPPFNPASESSDDCDELPVLCPNSPGIRSFIGSENEYAEIDAELLRIAGPPNYPDGIGQGLSMFTEPNARMISNIVATQPLEGVSRSTVSDLLWQWGQFIDHDVGLTEGADEEFQIVTPGCGTTDDICVINMRRAINHLDDNGVRQQLNEITGFLDASMVYGHTDERANNLRKFGHGLMNTTAEGNLLPNDSDCVGEENEDGIVTACLNVLPLHLASREEDLFIGGDVRVNEQIGLLAIHTLWVREHNRIAIILNDAYPDSSDEDIFQMARKLVTAEIQAVTYKEFLPVLIGPGFAPNLDEASFSDEVNPGIAHEFSTVAFRVGHTFLSENLITHNGVQQTGSFSLVDIFFDPGMARDDPTLIDEILVGQANQAANRADIFVIEEVRTNLFGEPVSGSGRDLVAFNIQRGRDHGVVRYNDMRAGYGLPRKKDFSEVSSDPDVVARLNQAYGGDINFCDPWICGLAEDVPANGGGQLGELFSTIIGNQFMRLMNGDRFFYMFDPDVTNSNLVAQTGIDVNSVTLADVINANTDTAGGVTHPAMLVADGQLSNP